MALFGILALDLATNTGWAYERQDAGPVMGSVNFKQPEGAHPGDLFLAFRQWFIPFCQLVRPERVVYEAPWLDVGTGQAATLEFLVGLAAQVLADTAALGLPVAKASSNTVRRVFCGNSRAKKPDVMAECQRRGWKPKTHDEGDAAALLTYAVHMYAPARYCFLEPRMTRS